MLWSLLVENAEGITRWASGLAAVLGLAALLLVTLGWHRVRRHYRDHVARVAVAVFRAVAAGSAILARSNPSVEGGWSEQPWLATTAFAILGYFFWEVAWAVGDSRHEASKEALATEHLEAIGALTKDRDDATLEATRREWLLAHLREPVGHELHRVRRVVELSADSRPSIAQAREGLAPEDQIPVILESLASLFRIEVIATGGSIAQNFRVGLYVEEGGTLHARDAFDLATRSHDPFDSPRTHPERYRLDEASGTSHAVECVRQGQTIIVADCQDAPGFEHTSESQRGYLRSMVAYPISDCRPDGVRLVRAALLIDTDRVGYFREDDRMVIESRVLEFVLRVNLEYAIRGLITRKLREGGHDE